jgi:hypothetical protein
MAAPLNPAAVPTVTHGYLFCLPSSERPDHSLDGRIGSYYQGLVPRVPRVTSYVPKNLDMTWVSPAANSWRTTYPVSNMAPPLLAEEEGPPI